MRLSAALLGTSVALSALVLAPAAQAQTGLFIAPQVSSLGIGGEVGYRLNDYLGVRASAHTLGMSRSFNPDDVEYNGKLRLQSFGGTVDVFPFGGSFRVSGGLRVNDNRADFSATPSSSVNIGGTTYTPSEVGRLNGRVSFNGMAPYAGIGWQTSVLTPNLYFGVDLGVMFQSSPKVTLTSTGGLATGAFAADLERERRRAEDKLDAFRLYPVISFSLGYRF